MPTLGCKMHFFLIVKSLYRNPVSKNKGKKGKENSLENQSYFPATECFSNNFQLILLIFQQVKTLFVTCYILIIFFKNIITLERHSKIDILKRINYTADRISQCHLTQEHTFSESHPGQTYQRSFLCSESYN